MKKCLVLWLLFLLSGCSVDTMTIKEYDGFSVDTARRMIVFPDKEFYYVLRVDRMDGKHSIDIYYDYNKNSGYNEWTLHFKREQDDSLTRIESEGFVPEQWADYDIESAVQELLPKNRVFFTELTMFMFKPWGIIFLYGCGNVLLNKEMMSLPMRVSRFHPYVPYDEAVHDDLCVKWGIGFMVVAVLWWFLDTILSMIFLLPLGALGIFFCMPKIPRS